MTIEEEKFVHGSVGRFFTMQSAMKSIATTWKFHLLKIRVLVVV